MPDGPSLYERNDAIDANLGLNTTPNKAPQVWAEKCTGLADKIRRVIVNWRKGSMTYQAIPEATFDVPILNDKDGGESDTDLRHSDLGAWGWEIAGRAWGYALEWAEKNGPIIDAQIVLCGWDEKTGMFRPLKGGTSARKCPHDYNSARGLAELREDHRDKVIDRLLEALDRRDLRVERMADKFVGMAGGIEKIMGIAFGVSEHAITISNSVSEAASREKQAERDFVREIVRMRTTGETIKYAISEVAPELKDIFNGFGPSAAGSYKVSAQELLKSITNEQREKAKLAGQSELIADMESILRKIVDGATDDESRAMLFSIGPRLNEAQAVIGPILTERQRSLVLALLKKAGLLA